MRNFLIIYRRSIGRIEQLVEFAEGCGRDAIRARFAAERQYQGDADVEMVVLVADSLATVRRTHGRYFMGPIAAVLI